jgi:hypothetical protein
VNSAPGSHWGSTCNPRPGRWAPRRGQLDRMRVYTPGAASEMLPISIKATEVQIGVLAAGPDCMEWRLHVVSCGIFTSNRAE